MRLEKLNPSVKAFTILLSVIILSFQYIIYLNVAIFLLSIFLLIFFSDAKLKRIVLILIPAFIAAFGLFMMGLYYAKDSSVLTEEISNISSVPFAVRAAASRNLTTALQLSTRLLSYAGLGILFALSTNGDDFVKSLIHQCHLSPKFAYGILAAFHLMPNMLKEYKNVRIAYEVRGIKTSFLSMNVIFTMLVNSIRWSECVAMAMESKGFSGKNDRTYLEVTKVHWYDILFSILTISFILTFMILFH